MGLVEDIRKEATGNGTKIQTHEEKQIEAMLNNLFYLDKDIENELIFLRSVMTRGQETAERRGLHASAVIVPESKFCYRQQVLSLYYKQLQGEQTPIGLKRIFTEGDAIHEKWQRLFIRGGLCKPLDCDMTHYNDDYVLTYTPDIIASIPVTYKLEDVYNDDVPKEDYIIEIKSVNTFMYKKQKYHASGRKQCQLYMYLTGIKKGLVLCDSKNDQEFKVYKYDYTPSEISDYISRLERIQEYSDRLLNYNKLVRRCEPCTGYASKRATDCPMKDVCYGRSKERLG